MNRKFCPAVTDQTLENVSEFAPREPILVQPNPKIMGSSPAAHLPQWQAMEVSPKQD
ncbi:hypothetical protein RSSM_01221 [Rhodopirellula sallentina SM41]|uniref:Uncharacterized protein n=1 Tax=Rhodopirellula sallentina SM41 TaxID=1263870 RepID=M5U7G5_9BACT|nr:hypothetical protein RSSM_01221 [Rhodopirellula sallentina SM41]